MELHSLELLVLNLGILMDLQLLPQEHVAVAAREDINLGLQLQLLLDQEVLFMIIHALIIS